MVQAVMPVMRNSEPLRSNPSLHPTASSGLRPLPSAGELKRWASRRTRSRSLHVRMFASPNRFLFAADRSVCVTSPPALISSRDCGA